MLKKSTLISTKLLNRSILL